MSAVKAVEPFCVLAAVVVGGLLAVLIVVTVRQARRREQMFRQWATRAGWTLTERPQTGWYRFLPGGNRYGVSRALSGTVRGRPVTVAEYTHRERRVIGETSSISTHRYVVVVVRLGRPYPLIAVDSRGAFSKLGRKLFGDGQAATGNDEFDRRFRIATKEPAIARQVVGPQLIAAHLAGTVPAWTVSGLELLTYREGTIDRPDRIPVLAEPTLRIADLLGR